jgi:hypothetical protein
MGFDETDPTARRRWEPEAQRERDAEILRLYRAGVSQRDIARTMDCTLGTVQLVIRREQKRAQQLADAAALGAPDHLLAMMTTDLTAEGVAGDPAQWDRLNPLERYRLRHEPEALALVAAGHRIPPIHDDDHQSCCVANGLDPNWRPYDHGVAHSWRQRCDAALSDDSGVDGDDW